MFYFTFLGMMIASFAGLGFAGNLALANRLGLSNGLAFATLACWFSLASGLAFTNRFGLANNLPLTTRFSLGGGFTLTDILGLFNILVTIYVRGCFADVITFADKLGLIVVTIAIIVRTDMRRCQIAATKLIGRYAC